MLGKLKAEERKTTGDEMVARHHQSNKHELEAPQETVRTGRPASVGCKVGLAT